MFGPLLLLRTDLRRMVVKMGLSVRYTYWLRGTHAINYGYILQTICRILQWNKLQAKWCWESREAKDNAYRTSYQMVLSHDQT